MHIVVPPEERRQVIVSLLRDGWQLRSNGVVLTLDQIDALANTRPSPNDIDDLTAGLGRSLRWRPPGWQSKEEST
jgi:hypothetical protein